MRAAFGANGVECGGVDGERVFWSALHRTGSVERQWRIRASGCVEPHDEQHAAKTGECVGVVGKIGWQLLIAAEDAVIAHASHAVGVPHAVCAQVDAHGVGGKHLVVDVVATGKHTQKHNQ